MEPPGRKIEETAERVEGNIHFTDSEKSVYNQKTNIATQSLIGFMHFANRAFARATQYPYSEKLKPIQKRICDAIGRIWYAPRRSALDVMQERGAYAASFLSQKWEKIRDSRYVSQAKMLHGAPLSTFVSAGAAALFNATSMKHGALIGLINYLAFNHIVQFVQYGTKDEKGSRTLNPIQAGIVCALTFIASGVMGKEFAKNILRSPISNKNAAVLALSSLIGTWYRNGRLAE